jgi:hypothetical protein
LSQIWALAEFSWRILIGSHSSPPLLFEFKFQK